MKDPERSFATWADAIAAQNAHEASVRLRREWEAAECVPHEPEERDETERDRP